MPAPLTLRTAVLAAACAAAAAPALAGPSRTLTTRDFRVTVTQRCAEGDIGCRNATYRGTNRRTGATIRLRGAVMVRMCADGVTPCGVLGYRFTRGRFVYRVTEGGTLLVTRGSRVLVRQPGRWS
ncbi:MAG: nuclear transport factor 2 family protein [Thermoleophilia bacterium]|nr:nuclear transport factor 2 family protein [Thermoleophilia bacterium]